MSDDPRADLPDEVETPIGKVRFPKADTLYTVYCSACGENIGGGFLYPGEQLAERRLSTRCVWCGAEGTVRSKVVAGGPIT
jgi:uncharacterized protein CbrC (UPF0167 family)